MGNKRSYAINRFPLSHSCVTSSVDWVTGTTVNDRIGASWFEVLERHRKSFISEGRPVEAKHQQLGQYRGKNCENVFWGKSERQGYMIILRGYTANRWWPDVLPVARKVSRLDLAVTVYLENIDKLVARKHYDKLTKKDHSQLQYRFWENGEGGQTIYAGSPYSDYRGKVYDKSAQRGQDAGKAWRYEVVMKSPKNKELGKRLFADWSNDKPVYQDIATEVYTWFSDRKIAPVFEVGNGQTFDIETEVVITSPEKKLRWLSTQVAPTVTELLRLGYIKDVGRALGVQLELMV